jgi:hypothetical protein
MSKRIYFQPDGVTVSNIGPVSVSGLPAGVTMVTTGTRVVADDVVVGVGYTLNSTTGVFSPPAPVVLGVPQITSPRQLKLALLSAGLLDAVDAFVASADRAVQISWEYSTEFHRDHPLLGAMIQAFGMSQEQVDQLFITAAMIP